MAETLVHGSHVRECSIAAFLSIARQDTVVGCSSRVGVAALESRSAVIDARMVVGHLAGVAGRLKQAIRCQQLTQPSEGAADASACLRANFPDKLDFVVLQEA